MQEETIQQKKENEWVVRMFEKRAIKKSALNFAIAYILILIIPKLSAYLFFWVADLLKLNVIDLVEDAAFQHLWQIAASLLMMLIPAVAFAFFEKKKIRSIVSFKPPKKELFVPFVFMGLGVCAFANIAANTLAVFLENFGISYSAPEMQTPEGAFGVALIIISTAITPAVVEEFMARGSFLGGLKEYGEAFAIVVSAITFGAMHGNLMQIPFAFIVGLILALAVIKTGSLWMGVVIHFINNFISVLLGDLLTFGGSVYLNILVSTLYFVISLTLAIVGVLMLKNKGKEVFSLEEGEYKAEFKEKLLWFFTSPMIILGVALTVAVCAGVF